MKFSILLHGTRDGFRLGRRHEAPLTLAIAPCCICTITRQRRLMLRTWISDLFKIGLLVGAIPKALHIAASQRKRGRPCERLMRGMTTTTQRASKNTTPSRRGARALTKRRHP